MRLKKLISLTLVMLALCVGRAYSQFDTSSLLGRVTDSTGAVMPGATVTATNVDTNVSDSRVTNKDGEYNIPALKEGTYRVTVKMAGFSDFVTEGIHLEVGTNQRVDAKVKVGNSEQVTVDENALELETDTSQKQQVISGDQVEAFPLQTMDYTDMLQLASGVTQDASGEDLGTSSVRREAAYNINGMRSTYNNFILDGIDNNAHGTSNQGNSNQIIQTNVYSIAQFSIVTTLPPAEYGRSAAGIINTETKSGTNKYHALVFEAIENTVLDANGFFVAYDANGNIQKTTLVSNQFGGNIGGPIFKGKFFFFGDYDGWRRIRNNVNESNIFSLPNHQLIGFTTSATTTHNITNPFTGETYPNTRPLPRNVLDPIALEILDAMPLPNNNDAGIGSVSDNYSVLQRFVNSVDKEDARLDGQFNQRTSGFVRVSQFKEHDLDGPTLPAPLSGGNGYFRTINQQVAIGVQRQIRATQLLEARLGVSYTKGGKLPTELGDPRTFGVQGLPTDPRVWGGLTSISISGDSAIGRQSTNPQWQYPFYLNPNVTYSYLLGHHDFKAGYEFGYMRQIVQDVNPIYGQMIFNSEFSESNFTDFLFGAPSEIDLTNFYVAHIRQGGHSAFFQDDWKLLPNLTVNLGVRYEYASHFYDKDDRLTNFDPVNTPISGQLIRARSGGSVYQKQLINPDLNDFMPRIGFALSPNRNLVVHGGYGIGYMHYTRSGEDDNLAINAPQVNQAVYNQIPQHFYAPDQPANTKPTPTFFTLSGGYPQGMADPKNSNLFTTAIKYIPRNYVDPYVQSWYIGFQSRISKTALFDAAFVGNHAIKLEEVGDYNQRRPELGSDPITGYFLRPNPAIGDIIETFNGGFSNYNGLQARFQEQGFHGLWFLNAFTWSRDFGNVVDPLTAAHGFSGSPQDYFHLTGDYGPLQYDLPIVNNTAMIWTLPVGRSKLLFGHVGNKMNNVIGGWQISAYNTYHSGPSLTPNFSPTGSQLLSNSGGIQYRPSFAVATAPTTANPGSDPGGIPLGTSLRSYAIKRLHIPNQQAQAFCDSVYDNPAQGVYNGCTLGFSTAGADPRGNVPVGLLRGDFYDELDASVMKKFQLPWNNAQFEIRVEFYNVLNKTNFTTPGMTCCSTSFGRIDSTYGPGRIGQIQARMWF
jgi:hypothetical protein